MRWLKKEMATQSSILAWKIPWQATVCGVAKELDMTQWLKQQQQQYMSGECVEFFSHLFLLVGG